MLTQNKADFYRGEGLFFQTAISFSRSFSDNVVYLDLPEDYDPNSFDAITFEKFDFPVINHIAQAEKIRTNLLSYNIHFGFVFRGFNFNF